jgi:hypothetical protein
MRVTLPKTGGAESLQQAITMAWLADRPAGMRF